MRMPGRCAAMPGRAAAPPARHYADARRQRITTARPAFSPRSGKLLPHCPADAFDTGRGRDDVAAPRHDGDNTRHAFRAFRCRRRLIAGDDDFSPLGAATRFLIASPWPR